MPEFSVVIPARNEEQFLPMTLDALERQVQPPAEVIVVDNGSRDATAQVARAWGATVLDCPERGVARARQLGLDHARSTWVASTDADSRPCPEWLARLDAATAGRQALYGPMRFCDVSPAVVKGSELGYGAFLHVCRVVGKPNLAAANMAYSRQAALLAGGYPVVEAYEDVILGQAIARLGEVAYVPGALVETSGRRLVQGFIPFLWQHAKNIMGHTRGYFGDDRAPAPNRGLPVERPESGRAG